MTHFSLIMVDVIAKDLPNIQEKICEELFLQLVIEGMDVTQKQVFDLIGELSFFPTDADRKALGYMNQILLYIEDLLNGGNYPAIDQINAIINTYPYSLDGGGKIHQPYHSSRSNGESNWRIYRARTGLINLSNGFRKKST